MSRQTYLLGVAVALVAGAFVLTDWLLTPPLTPGVTQANVRRLRRGMTSAEVRAILGDPVYPGSWVVTGDDHPPRPHLFGVGSEGVASVYLGDNHRVLKAHWITHPNANPLARLRAWLGW